METTSASLVIIAVLITGCEKYDFEGQLTDGFCIISGDAVVLNHHDVEYYDYSSHVIYLKNSKSFAENFENLKAFRIFADREEMYTAYNMPGYSSFMPSGPVIFSYPAFYGDYILPIGFIQIYDSLGNVKPDPREDPKIVRALKKYGQFREGLSCEIKSVRYVSSKNVQVDLLLKNNDSFNYCFLDPAKMGTGLFHYFTNGLSIRDFKGHKSYTHHTEAIQPQPWNSWKSDWLSIIYGNDSKTMTITYDNFDGVGPGQYKATFVYPGLAYQVKKDEITQGNGRIWLGSIDMIKEISIP